MGNIEEKRRHVRVDSFNLSYVCIDEDDNIVNQGMGRTLNVSESGILLETHFPTKSSQKLDLTIAIEDELVDLRGKVVYCRDGNNGMFETGVEFTDIDDMERQMLIKFIRMFLEHKQISPG